MFSEIIGDLLEMLGDAVMVAHNIRFDRDFVAAELSAAGVFLPATPCLCTLELAYRLQPKLLNHRLATCCAAAGVFYSVRGSHTAIDDARAEAALLRRYQSFDVRRVQFFSGGIVLYLRERLSHLQTS